MCSEKTVPLTKNGHNILEFTCIIFTDFARKVKLSQDSIMALFYGELVKKTIILTKEKSLFPLWQCISSHISIAMAIIVLICTLNCSLIILFSKFDHLWLFSLYEHKEMVWRRKNEEVIVETNNLLCWSNLLCVVELQGSS